MTTFFAKKNNAKTTVASALSSGATTLPVTDGSVFPASGSFIITIWDKVTYPDPSDDTNMEIVKCTSRTGNDLTIQRAQESTTDVTHPAGSAVEMLITAAQIVEIESTIQALQALKFIVQVADGNLDNEQALGALATGLLKNTTSTGVLSIAVPGTDYVVSINNSDTTLTVTGADGVRIASLNLNKSNNWLQQQYYSLATLTDSGGIAWNWATQRHAKFTGSSTTDYALAFPSNLQPGFAFIAVYQSSSGSNKLTFADSRYKQGASLAGLVGNANGYIVYRFLSDGTNIFVEADDYA